MPLVSPSHSHVPPSLDSQSRAAHHRGRIKIGAGECVMSDPEVLDRVLQNCDYRFRTVHCPHEKKAADITAAKWQISDQQWTGWTIIDCSLLPAGEVWCHMSCLPQLESQSK
jgi:hypothetical protein